MIDSAMIKLSNHCIYHQVSSNHIGVTLLLSYLSIEREF